MSNAQLGDASYVKTKLYYTTFYNLLSAYDDISYTTQSNNGRFDSYYGDNARGGSVEAGTDLIPMNTLKGAFHGRRQESARSELRTGMGPAAAGRTSYVKARATF